MDRDEDTDVFSHWPIHVQSISHPSPPNFLTTSDRYSSLNLEEASTSKASSPSLREIPLSIANFSAVGAPSTWLKTAESIDSILRTNLSRRPIEKSESRGFFKDTLDDPELVRWLYLTRRKKFYFKSVIHFLSVRRLGSGKTSTKMHDPCYPVNWCLGCTGNSPPTAARRW